MKPRILGASLVSIVVGLANTLWAHPGHGATDPSSLLHYTVESLHSWPLWLGLAAVSAGVLAWQLRRRLA